MPFTLYVDEAERTAEVSITIPLSPSVALDDPLLTQKLLMAAWYELKFQHWAYLTDEEFDKAVLSRRAERPEINRI